MSEDFNSEEMSKTTANEMTDTEKMFLSMVHPEENAKKDDEEISYLIEEN